MRLEVRARIETRPSPPLLASRLIRDDEIVHDVVVAGRLRRGCVGGDPLTRLIGDQLEAGIRGGGVRRSKFHPARPREFGAAPRAVDFPAHALRKHLESLFAAPTNRAYAHHCY